MSTTPSEQPNIGYNLIRIHLVVTRAIDVCLDTCARYASEGINHSELPGFVLYGTCLVTGLRTHHRAEDEIAFPCFQAKNIAAPWDVLAADHHKMQPILDALQATLDKLKTGADELATLATLQRSFQQLHALWHEHIGREESHLSCPILAAMLDAPEHLAIGGQMAQFGQANSVPHETNLPFVLFNLQPAERAQMTKLIPPEVVNHLVPVVWKEHWAPMQPFLLA